MGEYLMMGPTKMASWRRSYRSSRANRAWRAVRFRVLALKTPAVYTSGSHYGFQSRGAVPARVISILCPECGV